MNYDIIVKPTFQREAKPLAKHYPSFKNDYASLLDELERNPQLGTDLGSGLRKIQLRINRKVKGRVEARESSLILLLCPSRKLP